MLRVGIRRGPGANARVVAAHLASAATPATRDWIGASPALADLPPGAHVPTRTAVLRVVLRILLTNATAKRAAFAATALCSALAAIRFIRSVAPNKARALTLAGLATLVDAAFLAARSAVVLASLQVSAPTYGSILLAFARLAGLHCTADVAAGAAVVIIGLKVDVGTGIYGDRRARATFALLRA